MEREILLDEYKVTLESLVEKTKFCYSGEFYKLDEFEKQKYQKDKMATEAHLSTLCEILWGEKAKFCCGGLSDMFAIGLLGSMFNYGGFGNSPIGTNYPKKHIEENGDKESEDVCVVSEQKA